jgi:hypothetical protein
MKKLYESKYKGLWQVEPSLKWLHTEFNTIITDVIRTLFVTQVYKVFFTCNETELYVMVITRIE